MHIFIHLVHPRKEVGRKEEQGLEIYRLQELTLVIVVGTLLVKWVQMQIMFNLIFILQQWFPSDQRPTM